MPNMRDTYSIHRKDADIIEVSVGAGDYAEFTIAGLFALGMRLISYVDTAIERAAWDAQKKEANI